MIFTTVFFRPLLNIQELLFSGLFLSKYRKSFQILRNDSDEGGKICMRRRKLVDENFTDIKLSYNKITIDFAENLLIKLTICQIMS